MKKQITYIEQIPEFTDGVWSDVPTEFTIIANNQVEYDAHMTAITNPARGITDIAEEDLSEDEAELTNDDIFMLAITEIAEKAGITLETLPVAAMSRLSDTRTRRLDVIQQEQELQETLVIGKGKE